MNRIKWKWCWAPFQKRYLKLRRIQNEVVIPNQYYRMSNLLKIARKNTRTHPLDFFFMIQFKVNQLHFFSPILSSSSISVACRCIGFGFREKWKSHRNDSNSRHEMTHSPVYSHIVHFIERLYILQIELQLAIFIVVVTAFAVAVDRTK